MSKRNGGKKRGKGTRQKNDGLARAVEDSQKPYLFDLAMQTPKETEQRAREWRNFKRWYNQWKEAKR